MVTIQNHATAMTDVGAHTQRLLDHRAALGALLTGELRSHGNDGNIMHRSIGFHPCDELPPARIMNALSQVMVLDQVPYLQVFIGNQIVRCDQRVCRLPGKIFTLPLDFQIPLGESLAGDRRFWLPFFFRESCRCRRLSLFSALR